MNPPRLQALAVAVMLLGTAALAGDAFAAPESSIARKAKKVPTLNGAATTAKARPKPETATVAGVAATTSTTAAPPAKKSAAERTLDPVHIEGELDVPEVLFITARDQRRIVDFQHGRYLRTSRQLARETPLPTHIVVNRQQVTPAGVAK